MSWKLNIGSNWLQYLATTIAITGVTLSIASSDFVAASRTSVECEVASVTKHAEPGSLGCRWSWMMWPVLMLLAAANLTNHNH